MVRHEDQWQQFGCVAASSVALRRRLDALEKRLANSPSGQSAGQPAADGGEVALDDATMIDAMLSDATSLLKTVKPMATIAADFKAKWTKQRVQLMSAQEVAAETEFRQQREATARNAEMAAEEQMSAIAFNSEQVSQRAYKSVSADHVAALRKVVASWRQDVVASSVTHSADVDRVVQGAVERIKQWSAEEERYIMGAWAAELARFVTAAHALDEQAMMAAEDTQQARRTVLEVAMNKHWRSMKAACSEMREEAQSVAQTLREESSASRQAGANNQRVLEKTARAKEVQARLQRAKVEATSATETHRKLAEDRITKAQLAQDAKLEAFRSVMSEVGPMMQENLAKELHRLRPAAREAFQHVCEESSPYFPRRDEEAFESVADGVPMTPRATAEERQQCVLQRVLAKRSRLRGAMGAPAPSPSKRADPDRPLDGAFASGAGADIPADTQELPGDRLEDARLRLNEARRQLARGDWYKQWSQELAELVIRNEGVVKAHEAALKKQGARLKTEEMLDETMDNVANSFVAMAHIAKQHVSQVRDELARMRNMKAGLAIARADHIQEAVWEQEIRSPIAERDLLPFVSKLAREAETIKEIGKLLNRGTDRFPLAVVAGSWRRAAAVGLQLLARAWYTAQPPEQECKAFVEEVLALLSKCPESERLFQVVQAGGDG